MHPEKIPPSARPVFHSHPQTQASLLSADAVPSATGNLGER